MRESVLEKIPVYIMKNNPTLEALEAMMKSEERRFEWIINYLFIELISVNFTQSQHLVFI